MAVVQVSVAPNRSMYEQVEEMVAVEENRPAGLILQSAAEMPSGEVQIVSVWETAEAAQDFVTSRLFPAFEKAGVMELVMASPMPDALETFHLIR
jgi:hypothetical protein